MNSLLDADTILRYLLNDIPDQASETQQEIDKGAFTIGEVIAEVVYVLQGVYQLGRKDICTALTLFLDEINIQDKPVLKDALSEFENSSLDYVDCVLISRKKLLKDRILSFDKKLNKRLSQV